MSDHKRERLLAALRGDRATSDPVDLGGDVVVRLKVVPVATKDRLRAETHERADKRRISISAREEWVTSETIYEVLGAALEHEGLTAQDLRENLSAGVFAALVSAYAELERETVPATPVDVDALASEVAATLGEGWPAVAERLSALDTASLRRLLLSTDAPPLS